MKTSKEVREETTHAMRQVNAAANEAWMAAMSFYAEEVAKEQPFFTADDVFNLAEKSGMTETTHDKRAFGPVMSRLRKRGICEANPLLPTIPGRHHGSPLNVWKSLLYRGSDTRDGLTYIIDELTRLGYNS